MKKAYVFPGQASQFEGMGKDLYTNSPLAKNLFDQANEILGYRISDVMFEGSAEDLKQTKITQPAVFLHSIAKAQVAGIQPDATAGHSLGEFSALVAAGSLSFEDGLRLVQQRALAMQRACELEPSTMAAVLGLEDNIVEQICAEITHEIVVAANYNCPGQLVISGSLKGIEIACERLKGAGARRALVLQVGGAFHSPLMEPARQELAEAIARTNFAVPTCLVYQNVNAMPTTDPETIQQNLIAQLTAPVRWTQTIQNMAADGFAQFYEVGGVGGVLTGMIKKINREVAAENLV
jgi:[acyl-carrier-protein] S-malonyltransferase